MTPLQLIPQQQAKLLEMAKALFPEYLSIDFVGSCDFCLEGTLRLSKYEKASENWNQWLLIHWFEFCLTSLLDKLCDYGVMGLYNCTGLFIDEHPVDFLYEKFKKLNNGK